MAQAFEFEKFCGSKLIFVKNVLLFIFIFVQYAFIFKNANVSTFYFFCIITDWVNFG